jgi:hypothetical protein
MAEELIQQAEQFNDQASVPYSDEYLEELAVYYSE